MIGQDYRISLIINFIISNINLFFKENNYFELNSGVVIDSMPRVE
jgi:hypothetical protein